MARKEPNCGCKTCPYCEGDSEFIEDLFEGVSCKKFVSHLMQESCIYNPKTRKFINRKVIAELKRLQRVYEEDVAARDACCGSNEPSAQRYISEGMANAFKRSIKMLKEEAKNK